MGNPVCRYCGSHNVLLRDIEIRQVNIVSMLIASRQFVTELECRDCGWVGVDDPGPPVGANIQKSLQPLYG